jgi:hypothetical protein
MLQIDRKLAAFSPPLPRFLTPTLRSVSKTRRFSLASRLDPPPSQFPGTAVDHDCAGMPGKNSVIDYTGVVAAMLSKQFMQSENSSSIDVTQNKANQKTDRGLVNKSDIRGNGNEVSQGGIPAMKPDVVNHKSKVYHALLRFSRGQGLRRNPSRSGGTASAAFSIS